MGDQQTNAFAESEGDRYFMRNKSVAFDADSDPLCQLLRVAELRPTSILEIGASRGDRLAALANRHGCRVVGVEPSENAVLEGRSAHQIEMHVGTMSAVPLDEKFDVVLVNFVFHWVGRSDLLRSVAEVDRLVADGGHLGIGDFLPSGFTRTPYHHREGLWTFKQDYSALFEASGIYFRVATLTGRYGGRAPSAITSPAERAGFTLLLKSLDDHYLSVERS